MNSLQEDMDSQIDLRAVRYLKDSAKKVVDKAPATKKLLQGDSQGRSVGDDIK